MTMPLFIESALVGASVFALSIILTRRMASEASRLRLMDHPNERSLHAAPIPRGGGLAIMMSLALGISLEILLSIAGRGVFVFKMNANIWIGGATLFVALFSLWND